MPSFEVSGLPVNAKVSSNPTLHANLDRLRDRSIPAPTVRSLTKTLASLLALETALPSKPVALKPANGHSESLAVTIPQTPKIALIVILRAAISMTDAFLTHLEPHANIAVYHLGLFRDKNTLEPVEYFNKLPRKDLNIREAYILDPILATGGTASAAIGILKDWGVDHIKFISILASREGLEMAAAAWPEGTEFVVGAVDEGLDEKGYVVPGVGDIGDRLFGTVSS